VQRGQPARGLAGLREGAQRLDLERLAESLAARTMAPERERERRTRSGTRTSSLSTASMMRSIVRTAAIG
jgi:hypothetical protein